MVSHISMSFLIFGAIVSPETGMVVFCFPKEVDVGKIVSSASSSIEPFKQYVTTRLK